ncbi:MAG: WbqC family protein [Desulfobacteraceae bacterium]|nr:WbqC family protein [Desulfobacteraceae bacterium]MBC2718834.1 WbqC family protein [Desulfobacteraceae bacterium]
MFDRKEIEMKNGYVAIMQPYLFPYIGYFHLIEASSIFVFYDDVYYIKSGWINRNRILNQDRDCLFTVPISKVSSNKLINETLPILDKKWKKKFYKKLIQNYKKAPFFSDVCEVITSVFEKKYTDITDLAIESILAVYMYLGIEFNYTKSSICSPKKSKTLLSNYFASLRQSCTIVVPR